MSEKRFEKIMELTIAIGDGEEYITIKATQEMFEQLVEAIIHDSWIEVKDEWGFYYLINPRYVAYIKWKKEVDEE